MKGGNEACWPLTVYYDGGCPVCATGIARYRRLVAPGRLHFVDISDPGFRAEAHGLPLETFRRRMQVRDAQGNFHAGVAGLAAVWQALPGRRYRWLAVLVRLPGLRELASVGYALFARSRHLLPNRRDCREGTCRAPEDVEPRR